MFYLKMDIVEIKRKVLGITNDLFLRFVCITAPFFNMYKKISVNDGANKSLLVVRHGGIGDLLFLTPILRELKYLQPKICLSVMIRKKNYCIFDDCEFVDHIYEHAWLNLFKLFKADYLVMLDGVIEKDPVATTENIYDLLSKKYFNLSLSDCNKKPIVKYDIAVKKSLQGKVAFLQEGGVAKIGVQICAASPVRSPDVNVWIDIIKNICKNSDVDTVAFYILADSKNQSSASNIVNKFKNHSGKKIKIINCYGYTKDLNNYISMLKCFDHIITPDSSSVHLAEALNIPSTSVYGPFPSKIRTHYYNRNFSFDVEYPCSPCFTHGHRPCHLAIDRNVVNSPCFESINALDVAKKVIVSLQKDKNNHDYEMIKMNSCSEMSKFRDFIIGIINDKTFLDLNHSIGVEIGTAGDNLLPRSISVDLREPYTKCGHTPINIKHDAKYLKMFTNCSIDYIFSSHVFEDFSSEENLDVLYEWIRLLRSGGYLILLLPDQVRYVKYCNIIGEKPNKHHSISNFNRQYILSLAKKTNLLSEVFSCNLWEEFENDEYNFLIIFRKTDD